MEEAAALWRHLPDKLLFGLMLLAVVVVFHFWGNATFGFVESPSMFRWFYYVASTSPDDQHCLLVPVLVLGLLIWKRQALMALPKANWWPGLLMVALGFALHVAGFLVQQTRVSLMAFCLILYGLTGLVWGWRWLVASFFPMFLLVFVMPVGTLADALTLPLRKLVSILSVGISQTALGIDVIRDGVQIFDSRRTYQYEVAAACSGIRSLVAMFMVTTIYAFVGFRTNWKRLVVILSALPLAVLGNVARLTTVIVVAEAFGQEAGLMIETKFGFITFAVAIGCVLLIGYGLKEREPAAPPPSGTPLEARAL